MEFSVIALARGHSMQDLVYLGIVGICDPPRPRVREAISTLQNAGVTVKLVTGDAKETATAVGWYTFFLSLNYQLTNSVHPQLENPRPGQSCYSCLPCLISSSLRHCSQISRPILSRLFIWLTHQDTKRSSFLIPSNQAYPVLECELSQVYCISLEIRRCLRLHSPVFLNCTFP